MSKLKVQMNFQISKFKLELVYNLACDIAVGFGFRHLQLIADLKITYQSFEAGIMEE